MLTVGFIDYLNAFPLNGAFRLGILEPNSTLNYLPTPLRCNQLLREGTLDIGLVSSAEYLEGSYDLLPGFGVCSYSKILSVNLYTKKAPSQLESGRIGLTPHSATSIALLKILFKEIWKATPTLEPLDRTLPESSYDAILLIGDEALKRQTIDGFQTIDLAEAWTQMTGLPFVFAVFAVRKPIWEKEKAAVENFHKRLNAALNWAENNPEDIVAFAEKYSSLPASLIKRYYSLCHYRIGNKALEGLTLFKQLKNAL